MPKTKDLRIYQHHNLSFDRGDPVTIRCDGRPIRGFTREPVAVALYAADIPVLARSIKFHRPRGAFCLSGHCFSCLMRVDGVPNVRTCQVLCREGMDVESQSGFPKVDNDLLFVSDFLFRRGLNYHQMLTRPRLVNRIMMRLMRKVAAAGSLPEETPDPDRFPIRNEKADVLILGGGPAGLAAALSAAGRGLSVTIVDDRPEPGGHLLWESDAMPPVVDPDRSPGYRFAKSLSEDLRNKGVRFHSAAEAVAFYREGFFSVRTGEGLINLKAERTVVATGAHDQNVPFDNNDLPKIFSARGLKKLVNLYGICPGVKAMIVGSDDRALSLAKLLPEIGVRVLGLVEPGESVRGSGAVAADLERHGIPVFLNYKPERAIGSFHLKGLEIAPSSGEGERMKIKCDILGVSAPLSPAHELAVQAGCNVAFDSEKGFCVQRDARGRTNVERILAAGEVTGAGSLEEIWRQGRIAGLSAAADLLKEPAVEKELADLSREAADAP